MSLSMLSTDQQLQRVEDRQAIQEFSIVYGFVMDERDEPGIRLMFTDDATLNSQDGVFAAAGIENIVRFDDGDPDVARGLPAGHAEVVRDGVGMLLALRFKDQYRREHGRWKFAARLMSYLYYLPATEYPESFGAKDSMRAYGDRRSSDWPETLYGPSGSAWLADYF